MMMMLMVRVANLLIKDLFEQFTDIHLLKKSFVCAAENVLIFTAFTILPLHLALKVYSYCQRLSS
jgi:hypothetical protein